MQPLRARIAALLNALCAGLYEREEPMRLALLSALAGESIFLLGPPGVGKSLIARRLKFAFRDGTSFEYLMSRFSTPDEIFGPVSIRKLREEDKYERQVERYLPGANIVFLDEIWKSGPAIQNALLTILNEKIFRNGDTDLHVDIKGIIAASNELPPAGQSFEPLWDRFLIRMTIGGISLADNFLRMITDTGNLYGDPVPDDLKITRAELDAWSSAIDAIAMPPEVLNTLQVIRYKVGQYNDKPAHAAHPIQLYDRRWKKIVQLMRTSAFLCGRDHTDLMDCFLLPHCLWGHPEHEEPLREIVAETVRKHGYSIAVNLTRLRREVEEFDAEVAGETQVRHTRTEEQLLPVKDEYYALEQRSAQFDGRLVKIAEFNALKAGEETVMNIYDDDKNLLYRLKGRLSGDAHALELLFNAQWTAFRLQTVMREAESVLFRQPHPYMTAHLEARYTALKDYLNAQLRRMKDEEPPQLRALRDHLFTDPRLAPLVTENLAEVSRTLDRLALQLDRARHGYMRG